MQESTDTVYLYHPENQNIAYLVVSKASFPLGFQKYSYYMTYIFSIDIKSRSIYSSLTQNVDIFSSLSDAINFLSLNYGDVNMTKLGNFLIGASVTEAKSDSSLCISVAIDDAKSLEKVASIANQSIYKILKIKSYSLNFNTDRLILYESECNVADFRYYFSPTLDLSSTFPYYYINQFNLKNNMFAFNRPFLTRFVENKILLACVIVIKGQIYSENNLMYITKICNCFNDSSNIKLNEDDHGCESECELIYKDEKANYFSHAWRRGPTLCFNENFKDKLAETKRYIWNEIRSRFNIEKVHILSLNSSDDKNLSLIKPGNDLKNYLGVDEITIQSICEERKIIENKMDEVISKISNSFSIPKNGNSLFTVLDSNGEIICIQDFIYRFMSSDSLKMTDMITCAFLPKIAELMLQSIGEKQIESLKQSTLEMSKILDIKPIKRSQSILSKIFKDATPTEFFKSVDDKVNTKFLLDSQHTSFYSIKDNCSLIYTFPEPFIVSDLHFLVHPQEIQTSNTNFDVYILCLPSNTSAIRLTIPYVFKKTWLHYDFRYIIKKSLQCFYHSDFICPISSIRFDFKFPNEKNFIEDLRIGVKRATTKAIFKYIVPENRHNIFDIKESEINYIENKRSLADLINLNNYRIMKHYVCSIKNNMISTKCNPWFYDLKSQLIISKDHNLCPLCNEKKITNGNSVKIINEIDPILFIKTDNVDNKKNCIKICSDCANKTKSMIDFYNENKENFIFVDNSNSIFFSMHKYHSPSYYYSKPDGQIDLSKLCQFSDKDFTLNKCLFKNSNSIFSSNKNYALHFSTEVNINKIRIELNENTIIESDFQIKINFNKNAIIESYFQKEIKFNENAIIMDKTESSFIFEKIFSIVGNVISFKFTTKNEKALINVKKIDIIGSLPKSPFFHPRYEIDKKNINSADNIDVGKLTFDSRLPEIKPINRVQEFNVSYKNLYGIYLKLTASKFQPKSLVIRIKGYITNLILPQIPLEEIKNIFIFYFPFSSPIPNVSNISILYLDSVPEIEKISVSFNGTK